MALRIEDFVRGADLHEAAPPSRPPLSFVRAAEPFLSGETLEASPPTPAADAYPLDLVAFDRGGNRLAVLSLQMQRLAPQNGAAISTGQDASGLVIVRLALDTSDRSLRLDPRSREWTGLPVAELPPALRFLSHLHTPTRVGIAVPGSPHEPRDLMEVPLGEPPVARDTLQIFVALAHVAEATGADDLVAPAEIPAATVDAILKADRLLDGDIVHHAWRDVSVTVDTSMLDRFLDAFGEQAALDLAVPLRIEVGGRELRLADRWVRIRSARLADREAVLATAREEPTRAHVDVKLIPGVFEEASSRLGEFPPLGSSGYFGGRQADALRPHLGRWVATKGLDVVASANTLAELLVEIRDRGLKPDTVGAVPPRGDIEVGDLH